MMADRQRDAEVVRAALAERFPSWTVTLGHVTLFTERFGVAIRRRDDAVDHAHAVNCSWEKLAEDPAGMAATACETFARWMEKKGRNP